jgi:aldehyde dehydrogenase (NAD(P)+)
VSKNSPIPAPISRSYEPLSTENPIAKVHAASEQDVDKAVQAAKAALKHESWKLLPGTERGILMAKLADLIEEEKELLATIDAWDNGT